MQFICMKINNKIIDFENQIILLIKEKFDIVFDVQYNFNFLSS